MKPILRWQYEQITKGLLLIQGHGANIECPCSSEGEMCLRKHLLEIEALCEETSPICDDEEMKQKLFDLAKAARELRADEELRLCGKDGQLDTEIDDWARGWRKEFEQVCLVCDLDPAKEALVEEVARMFEAKANISQEMLEAPMKLLTQEIRKKLPALYSQENVADPMVQVKFFTPDSNWTWYATEFDPKQELFFGWVVGFEKELGYFSLKELESARGPMGLAIERDLWFKPQLLSEVKKLHQAEHGEMNDLKDKLMASDNLVILPGQDSPKPDKNGFWELKSGENYNTGEVIKLGDTVKLKDNSIASIKWISYNPDIGGRVHYTVDWGASWQNRPRSELRLIKRKAGELANEKSPWKAYEEIGNYLRVVVVEGREDIQACPMMRDGSRATDEEITDVDDWSQLFYDLFHPPGEEQDDWKQALIEEIQSPLKAKLGQGTMGAIGSAAITGVGIGAGFKFVDWVSSKFSKGKMGADIIDRIAQRYRELETIKAESKASKEDINYFNGQQSGLLWVGYRIDETRMIKAVAPLESEQEQEELEAVDRALENAEVVE